MTRYLGAVKDFVGRGNSVFLGGVMIDDAAGVAKIGSIVKARARGRRLRGGRVLTSANLYFSRAGF